MEKPDISDTTDISDKWDGNLENIPGEGPDKTDRFNLSANMSGLSGPSTGHFDRNLENMSPSRTDSTVSSCLWPFQHHAFLFFKRLRTP